MPHILVVDDDLEIANSLHEFLSNRAGYRLSYARNGLEAKEFLEKSLIDPRLAVELILLDMRMPIMSGTEVLNWLRNHEEPALRFARVVVLTATAGSEEKVEALSAGADDYITKPYYPQELLARVKTILRSRQLEDQLQRQQKQLEALNVVSRSLAAELDSENVIDKALMGAQEILAVDLVALFMVDRSQTLLRCRRVSPEDKKHLVASWPAIKPGAGPIGAAYASTAYAGSAVQMNNEMNRTPPITLDVVPEEFGVKALMASPLILQGKPLGVLGVFFEREREFSENDRGLFASLTRSVSQALENAWLFENVQRRQQELLESRNTLQAVINGIQHPIYTIDDNYQLISVNETKSAGVQDFGEKKAVGKTCYETFYGYERPCSHCQANTTLAARKACRWSFSWVDEDHRYQEWDVSAYPIPGKNPGSARAVVVWQDRTEEKRLEQSLMQAGKLAAVGQLAAGVAHEINNPLTAINANAQMLQMVIPPDDDNYESIDLIAQAGQRAASVVQGLLDLAREKKYELDIVSVNESIEQAVNLVAYQFKNANIKIKFDLAPDLPEIQASREHLQSVWLNILINARDALAGRVDEKVIEISTEQRADDDHVAVRFYDNGNGISEAELGHIFEPFFTTKDPGKGTGLGLATSHRIVEQHGGTIDVISSSEYGTTFTVRLPVEARAFPAST